MKTPQTYNADNIDAAVYIEKLSNAAMPFFGARLKTIYDAAGSQGYRIDLDSVGVANGYQPLKDQKAMNGVYFVAEKMKDMSDAEILFLRDNFKTAPFYHAWSTSYMLNGQTTVCSMNSDTVNASDSTFTREARNNGLAIITGSTKRPAETPKLQAGVAASLLEKVGIGVGMLGTVGLFVSFFIGMTSIPSLPVILTPIGLILGGGGIAGGAKLLKETLLSKDVTTNNAIGDESPFDLVIDKVKQNIEQLSKPIARAHRQDTKYSLSDKELAPAANTSFKKQLTGYTYTIPTATASRTRKEIIL